MLQSNLEKASMSITNIKNMIENERISDLDPSQLVKELLAIKASIDEAVKMYEQGCCGTGIDDFGMCNDCKEHCF